MKHCPYLSKCEYSDFRACKSNYDNCIIYVKKEAIRDMEIKSQMRKIKLEEKIENDILP